MSDVTDAVMDGCYRCRELEEQVALLTTDLGNVEQERRKGRRRETALTNKLRRALGEDPSAEQVRIILGHYNDRLGKRCKYRPLGKNDEVIRAAMKSGDTLEEGARLCFEAIDGLALKPFVVQQNGRAVRAEQGKEGQRYDSLSHCLGDEDKIARFAGYARAAKENGDRITSWSRMVDEAWYEDAIAEAIEQGRKAQALQKAVEILRDFVAMQDGYIARLEAELEDARRRALRVVA